jgi:ROS/MUCR transcriptional regulator protein
LTTIKKWLEALDRLPKEGDWKGPIFGAIGVLQDDGERVECHCCGKWYRHLGPHIPRHGITAPEYRALFGLRAQTAVSAKSYADAMRRKQTDHLKRVAPVSSKTIATTMTPEERSLIGRGRTLRRENVIENARSLRTWIPISAEMAFLPKRLAERKGIKPAELLRAIVERGLAEMSLYP